MEAWIDIGGTFTDCFVKTDTGELLQTKVLSSGRVPLSVQQAAKKRIVASELTGDVDGFWVGAKLVVVDASGSEIGRVTVEASSQGSLTLAKSVELSLGAKVEVDSGLHAPVLGIRRLIGVPLTQPLPRIDVRLGTTRGTNALLTRNGAQAALAITDFLEDLLLIGDQTRPDLFALDIVRPPPLARWTIPIDERINAAGVITRPLDEASARKRLAEVYDAGCRSLAICLLHSYTNPDHEQALESIAREVGFEFISVSSRLAPLIEIVPRAQTTVVDAYLSPTIRSYLAEIATQLGQGQLSVMTSAGGLMPWQEYSGKDCILSGPAGGVVALRALSKAVSEAKPRELIGIDMGGTSADVCQAGSAQTIHYESTKAGVRILTPTLPIETVASGGGSVCWFDGVSLRVGPDSAGAQPGPAAYGRDGPLTITDVNIYLNLLPAEQFPFPIDESAVARRLDEITQAVASADSWSSTEVTPARIAEGFRAIACQQMSEAVRAIAAASGTDLRQHALVGFGGAAGQHVCDIADLLGMKTIFDTPQAGLLSALGMGLADTRRDKAIAIYAPLHTMSAKTIAQNIAEAADALQHEVLSATHQSDSVERVQVSVIAELRYEGTDAALAVPVEGKWNAEAIRQEFESAHRGRFGYARPEKGVELVSLRVAATLVSAQGLVPSRRVGPARQLDGKVLDRTTINPGDTFAGPVIVSGSGSTLLVRAGWSGQCRSDDTIELSRTEPSQKLVPTTETADIVDPIVRDCYSQRLRSIAEEMGIVLQQTAASVNVKQRRDYSCALFDRNGFLLSSAPHVPVHLGAMGTTVRSVMQHMDSIQPGDVFVTNDPFRGGSHLPDVTVITPVFESSVPPRLRCFAASRAHHADIGGIAPGSMSPKATSLADEGVLIKPMLLSSRRVVSKVTDGIEHVLRSAAFPPRHVEELLADLDAQRAAGQHGVNLVTAFAREEGWQKLENYFEAILAASEQRVRAFVGENAHQLSLPATARDSMDDGTKICVKIGKGDDAALVIDFEGTGPVSSANFNANPSIVSAAVMYVIRLLIADDLPLNEGVLRCVDLRVPEGILNPPRHEDPAKCAAVAAGNVETSQRVVDVLLAAFGLTAASQGTMNNLLFGNASFGFYETICGGAGATVRAAGASAVHTHMTNTRLTDPEVLEARYPVELTKFSVRRESGGAGKHRGGDGVVRQLKFTEPVELSLITSRRTTSPPGMAGGSPGQPGRNTLLRQGEAPEQLPGTCSLKLVAGDEIQISTPGGGGYG